jgi:hypothetical protein
MVPSEARAGEEVSRPETVKRHFSRPSDATA